MTSRAGFQTQVNTQPAPAVEGDFASTNPRWSMLAGAGAILAGAAGVTIGKFCWVTSISQDPNAAPAIANSFGAGPVSGFVHREQQGLITAYLTEAGMTIIGGAQMTVMSGGDFWVKNRGTTQALPGQKAYANFADGGVTFAVTGSPTTGSANGSIGPQTATFVGAINGNVLTVTSLASGTIVVGGTLTGGTGVTAGTQIISQLTGTIGGVGTYAVNYGEQSVGAALLTESYGLLTIASAGLSGTLGVGQSFGTTAGLTAVGALFITALGTGTGGAGTYILNVSQTVASQLFTFSLNVETKWIAMSSGLAGELVKITDHPLG